MSFYGFLLDCAGQSKAVALFVLLKKLISISLNSARYLLVLRWSFTGGDEALPPTARAVDAPAARSDSRYCRPAFLCSFRRSFVHLMMANSRPLGATRTVTEVTRSCCC